MPVIYFAILSYLKYYLNDLSIATYNLFYIGNIVNIILLLSIVIGIAVVTNQKKVHEQRFDIVLVTCNTISIILLGAVLLIEKGGLVSVDKMLFNFPLKKVYIGATFISSFFMHIYVMIHIWGHVIGKESLIELRTLVRTVLFLLGLMIFSLLFVWNVSTFSEARLAKHKYQYVCIPGAAVWKKEKPSPIFEARIRKAFELYKKGTVKKIILTGGNAPGEAPEALAAFKYLTNLDVNRKRIILENKTSTTTEQVKYLYNNFKKAADTDSLLIVSDGFHLSRIIQISKFFKIKLLGVSSNYDLSFEKTIFYRTRESIALLLFWIFAI